MKKNIDREKTKEITKQKCEKGHRDNTKKSGKNDIDREKTG